MLPLKPQLHTRTKHRRSLLQASSARGHLHGAPRAPRIPTPSRLELVLSSRQPSPWCHDNSRPRQWSPRTRRPAAQSSRKKELWTIPSMEWPWRARDRFRTDNTKYMKIIVEHQVFTWRVQKEFRAMVILTWTAQLMECPNHLVVISTNKIRWLAKENL